MTSLKVDTVVITPQRNQGILVLRSKEKNMVEPRAGHIPKRIISGSQYLKYPVVNGLFHY